MNDDRYVLGYKPTPPDGIWFNERDFHPLFTPTAAGSEETPAQLQPPPEQKQVEICRSFSYKLNLSKFGRDYESADFFCSRKLSCGEEDAKAMSALIFEECVEEIRESMQAFVESITSKKVRRPASAEVARR